jgi:hypothetical protein
MRTSPGSGRRPSRYRLMSSSSQSRSRSHATWRGGHVISSVRRPAVHCNPRRPSPTPLRRLQPRPRTQSCVDQRLVMARIRIVNRLDRTWPSVQCARHGLGPFSLARNGVQWCPPQGTMRGAGSRPLPPQPVHPACRRCHRASRATAHAPMVDTVLTVFEAAADQVRPQRTRPCRIAVTTACTRSSAFSLV